MSEPVIQLNKLTEKPVIIGRSKAFLDTLQKLYDYSQYRSIAILLYGESGVGKSFLARSCGSHNFVSVNCGSVTDTLVNSLFGGHIRGAFTDAKKSQSGFVASAEGGTLFLDEIGDLGLSAQPLLLTIIEEKEYIVVGENFTRKADVQFIAATNKDLNKMVSEGSFRGDLLERLTIKIYVPGLNERGKEDISLLCDYLFTKHETELNKECSSELRKKFLELALLHDWKNSNIRGLSNFIFQTVVEERIPEVMETSSEEIFTDTPLVTGNLGITSSPETRAITYNDLINAYFNPEKTILEMEKNIESDYLTAVNNLSHVEAAKKLGVSSSFCYKYKYKDEFFERKINIILNDNISLKEILLHFKDLAIVKMSKHFPKMRKADLTKKIGVGISTYYRAIENTQSSNLYLGHVLETKDDILLSQETNISENNPQTNEEINTVTTFPFDVLKSQLFDFFEDYKRLQIELEKSKAKNKDLEDTLMAVRRAITII